MSYTVLFLLAVGAVTVTLLTNKWLTKQHAKYKATRFARGYTFAMDTLLSGTLTPHELLEQAHNPFGIDEFDRGIKQAVHDYLTDKKHVQDTTSREDLTDVAG
jgi:hypothetical protein